MPGPKKNSYKEFDNEKRFPPLENAVLVDKTPRKTFFASMYSETPPNERKVVNLRTRNGERGRGTDKTRPLELYGVYSFKASLILNTNKN